VEHSIPTLGSITVTGNRGKDSWRVAAIIGVLVPTSSKRHRVAPRLTTVELRHGANGVVKAGKAIAAGLWPALKELVVPIHHGNTGHFSGLTDALRLGCAPNLRVLDFGYQSRSRADLSNSVLWALSAGKCPHLEKLNFVGDSSYFDVHGMDALGGALQACSSLRELRMDGTRFPEKQLRDLLSALQAGHLPRLMSLSVRTPGGPDKVAVDALTKAAAARVPPIAVRVY